MTNNGPTNKRTERDNDWKEVIDGQRLKISRHSKSNSLTPVVVKHNSITDRRPEPQMKSNFESTFHFNEHNNRFSDVETFRLSELYEQRRPKWDIPRDETNIVAIGGQPMQMSGSEPVLYGIHSNNHHLYSNENKFSLNNILNKLKFKLNERINKVTL